MALAQLDDRRSELNKEIEQLTAERQQLVTQRELLSQQLTQTLEKADQLAVKYKNSESTSQHYLRELKETGRQLQQTVVEAKNARAAAEAAVWHVGDKILIRAIDESGKPVSDYSIERRTTSTTELTDEDGIRWTITPRPFPLRLTVPAFLRRGDKDGRFTYELSKEDINSGEIQFIVSKVGYQRQSISIQSGTKSATAILSPTPPSSLRARLGVFWG